MKIGSAVAIVKTLTIGLMTCPHCGTREVSGPECPHCGVVVAKVKDPRDRPALRSTAMATRTGMGGPLLAAVLVIGLVAAAGWRLRHSPTPVAPARPAGTPASATISPAPGKPLALPTAATLALPPTLGSPTDAFGQEDRQALAILLRKLDQKVEITDADLMLVEGLSRRHPGDRAVDNAFDLVYAAAALQQWDRRQRQDAIAKLRAAAAHRKDAVSSRSMLVGFLLEMADWLAAEATAREILAVDPRHFVAWRGLGFALMHQDRTREAISALETALSLESDPTCQALLAKLQKGLQAEQGMKEQQIPHFNVRYDGEAHDEVGREILRALERHYAKLVIAFDHEPPASIAVILFTRERYFDASGAPAWSGGAYDNLDGRIRIPIADLTTELTARIDSTLLHELTHAFVAEMSAGVAPREIHEGLAQFMEGKRLDTSLTPAQVTALTDGRIRGVSGFYLAALGFVEYLMAERGQGGINDLLGAMAQTRDVDRAFNEVYGRGYQGCLKAWADRMRVQHGSS